MFFVLHSELQDPVRWLSYRTALISFLMSPSSTPLLWRNTSTHAHKHTHTQNGVHHKKLTLNQLVNKFLTFHTFTRPDICADTKSMKPATPPSTYFLKIYFNITLTEHGSNYRSFTSIANLNVPEFKGLFHRRVSKSQPTTSKKTSHLLKMFVNAWCSSRLEIQAISLQIFSFSSCKGCGLFTKFCLYMSLQIIIAQNQICRYRGESQWVSDCLPNTSDRTVTENFTMWAMAFFCIK